MAIGDTDVELEFTNVQANVPIVVGIQNTGVDTEILVRYGIQRFTATLGVDYSLIFPVDLLTFQLTPTQSLMDKLLAAGPTNVIYVQRVLPLTSDFDYDNAFVRQKLVDEFNRVWMVLQQEDFRLGLASPVTSWNERTGDVHLFLTDITDVGGTPIASPHFTGVPLAPTAAPGTDTTQIATVEFVNNAVEVGVTSNAVTSFNGRQGNVSLQLGDVTGVGGAPIAGPAFTGSASFAGPVAFATSPTAPTPATADSSTKVATTAYVGAAVAAISSGVVSWNGRVGVVTMTLADITGVGGAAASAIPVASSAVPIMNGIGVAGVATAWAHGDHVHPSDTSRVAKAGDTMAGDLVITKTTPALRLNAGVSDNALIQGQKGGLDRWVLIAGDSFVESGSNVGSDFGINRYNDAGTYIERVLTITRSTGQVTLSADPSTPLSVATKQYVDTKAPLASPALTGNPTAPTPTTGDNDTSIATTAFVKAVVASYLPLTGGAISGGIDVAGTVHGGVVNSDAGITAGGNITAVGAVIAGAFSVTGAGRGQQLSGAGGPIFSSVAVTAAASQLTVYNPNGAVGSINTNGTTTAYNTTSDERLKTFNAEYDPDEAIRIIRADPVKSFTWKSSGEDAVGWFAQSSYEVDHDLATPPEAGAKEGEDRWGIDYGKRTPYLWAALTRALDRIDALEARLAIIEKPARL